MRPVHDPRLLPRAGTQCALVHLGRFLPLGRPGYATADGYLAVTGRIKDTIVRAGENVAADDVEEHLLAHPAVGQVAVVGLPTTRSANASAPPSSSRRAIRATPPDRAALRQFLTDRGLATFKMPDQVAIVGSLPVTAVGKIDKRSLTTTLLAAQSARPLPSSVRPVAGLTDWSHANPPRGRLPDWWWVPTPGTFG